MHMQQGTAKAQLACEELLQRLRVEYVDLLLIHWPGVAKLEVTQLCFRHAPQYPPFPTRAFPRRRLQRYHAVKGILHCVHQAVAEKQYALNCGMWRP